MTIPRLPSYEMPVGPVENRVNWRPEPTRAALLIHDMQAYFLNKFDPALAPVPALVANIRQIRAACDAAGVPVFYTAQPVEQPPQDRALLNDFWGPGLTQSQHHAEQPVIAELAPRAGDIILTKWRYSAFQRSDLREQLRTQGLDQLLICGIYAHIGCMATALEAFMQDVQPFFLFDAVADFSLEEHLMAARYVSRRCGVSLTVQEAEQALRR